MGEMTKVEQELLNAWSALADHPWKDDVSRQGAIDQLRSRKAYIDAHAPLYMRTHLDHCIAKLERRVH